MYFCFRQMVNRALKSGTWGQSRQGRAMKTVNPGLMRRALLEAHEKYSEGLMVAPSNRTGIFGFLNQNLAVVAELAADTSNLFGP